MSATVAWPAMRNVVENISPRSSFKMKSKKVRKPFRESNREKENHGDQKDNIDVPPACFRSINIRNQMENDHFGVHCSEHLSPMKTSKKIQKKEKKRMMKSIDQVSVIQEFYDLYGESCMSFSRISQIMRMTGLSHKQVYKWIYDKRARDLSTNFKMDKEMEADPKEVSVYLLEKFILPQSLKGDLGLLRALGNIKKTKICAWRLPPQSTPSNPQLQKGYSSMGVISISHLDGAGSQSHLMKNEKSESLPFPDQQLLQLEESPLNIKLLR